MTDSQVKVRHCRRGSRFGKCDRAHGHEGEHAVHVGEPDFWFAWAGRDVLGYGRYDADQFRPAS